MSKDTEEIVIRNPPTISIGTLDLFLLISLAFFASAIGWCGEDMQQTTLDGISDLAIVYHEAIKHD